MGEENLAKNGSTWKNEQLTKKRQVFRITDYGYVLTEDRDKFTSVIYSREHKGLNTILLIVGPRGIGKSYMAMKIAEHLSFRLHTRIFGVEDVVFSMEEFLTRVKAVESLKYSWIVFDEVGLEVPAREFMKIVNKIMSYVAQSFRHTAVNLIIVVPHESMIDIHLQMLADLKIVMKGRGRCRVYKCLMNPFRNEPRTPLLCELEAGLPTEQLYKAYEQKRNSYLDNKYEEFQSELEQDRKKNMPMQSSGNRASVLAEIKQEYLKGYVLKNNLAFEIQRRLGVGNTASYQIRNRLLSEIAYEEQKARKSQQE